MQPSTNVHLCTPRHPHPSTGTFWHTHRSRHTDALRQQTATQKKTRKPTGNGWLGGWSGQNKKIGQSYMFMHFSRKGAQFHLTGSNHTGHPACRPPRNNSGTNATSFTHMQMRQQDRGCSHLMETRLNAVPTIESENSKIFSRSQNSRIQGSTRLPHFDVPGVRTTCH